MTSLRASIGIGLVAALAATVSTPAIAWADECPGHPDALGTSRVLVVDPGKITHVGVMQYPQSLPLADKEVVLTFDDGPIPPYSATILDILAAQCVKVTYFLVGEMAREHPALVRRIHEEGHTIGTHSEDHPSRMERLPIYKTRAEIDRGIADVRDALWDPKDLAPFFRIPGLARSDAIEQELAARGLIVFSSDMVADDWFRRIRPAEIVRRAMSRLQQRGKGILLLHDIHASTVAALPELLKKLKEAGFHVVHIVPGIAAPDPDTIEIASQPAWPAQSEWNWPDTLTPVADKNIELPAPDAASFTADYSEIATYLALHTVPQWSDPPPAFRQAARADMPNKQWSSHRRLHRPRQALRPRRHEVRQRADVGGAQFVSHFRHRTDAGTDAFAGFEIL